MRVIVLAAVIGLALVSGALAQRSTGTATTGQGATNLPPAPVGHRQPTAADVATNAPSTPEEEARRKADEKLDRALKGICRGC